MKAKARKFSDLSDFDLVDRLGIAKAASALARSHEEELLAEVKRRYPKGGAALFGGFFDASVAMVPGKESLDREYVESHMHPNSFRRALKVGDPYLSIKVVAKRREAA